MYFPIRDGKYRVEPGLRKLGPREPLFLKTKEFESQIKEKWRLSIKKSPLYLDPSASPDLVDEIILTIRSRVVSDLGRPLSLGSCLGMQIQEDLAIISC
jgi:hypothetical protein